MRHLVVASMLFAAAPLAAQSDPVAYCPAGTEACFALKTQFTRGEDHRSTFSIWIQNLQGLTGFGSLPFSITGFRFLRANGEETGDGTFSEWLVVNAAHDAGVPEGPVQLGWGFSHQFRGDEGPATDIGYGTLDASGFMGCASFDPTEMLHLYRTCLPDGIDGWMRWDVTLFRVLRDTNDPIPIESPEDFTLALGWSYAAGGNGELEEGGCQFSGSNSGIGTGGVHCEDIARAYPVAAVPEPATMLLLGTGLAAIGGVIRRRTR